MSDIESPIQAYVTALVGIGGQLVTTVDHMRRHAGPQADPIPDVLARLLSDIVADEVERPPDDFYAAAALIDATGAAIEENLFLVDP